MFFNIICCGCCSSYSLWWEMLSSLGTLAFPCNCIEMNLLVFPLEHFQVLKVLMCVYMYEPLFQRNHWLECVNFSSVRRCWLGMCVLLTETQMVSLIFMDLSILYIPTCSHFPSWHFSTNDFTGIVLRAKERSTIYIMLFIYAYTQKVCAISPANQK